MADDANDYETANAMYRKAIELDPTHSPSYFALGQLYEKVGADREAMQVYREAVRLNRDDVDNREFLAALLMKYGRAEEALDLLLSVEQLDPSRREVLFAIGSAFLTLGNDKNAKFYFERYTAPPNSGAAVEPANGEVARVILTNIRKKEDQRLADQ
jgi:tetratricopeptide (TPR) repeat protein